MTKKAENLNFEKSLHELERIIEAMETGDLELEAALEQFEKGVELIRKCQKSLKQAEHKVQILTEKNGKTALKEFESE